MTDKEVESHLVATATVAMISPEQCIGLRHVVLRPGQALGECEYPGDLEASSFHLGAFVDDELLCIASFYGEASPELQASDWSSARPYRLRGMAVAPGYQRRGLGAFLLRHGELELQRRGAEILWCNARVSAEGFYSKLGYEKAGEEFEIAGIGGHFRMVKKLGS